MFNSFPLDDTGCDFLFAGTSIYSNKTNGITALPTGIGNLISSSSYIQEPVENELVDTSFLFNEEDDENTFVQPSRNWNEEPAKEIYMVNNSTNETTVLPLRVIEIKSIVECRNGYLIKSTEKNSTYYFVSSSLFKTKEKLLKTSSVIKVLYSEKQILKPTYDIRFSTFGKTGSLSITEKNLMVGTYREVRKIYLPNEIVEGVDFL